MVDRFIANPFINEGTRAFTTLVQVWASVINGKVDSNGCRIKHPWLFIVFKWDETSQF